VAKTILTVRVFEEQNCVEIRRARGLADSVGNTALACVAVFERGAKKKDLIGLESARLGFAKTAHHPCRRLAGEDDYDLVAEYISVSNGKVNEKVLSLDENRVVNRHWREILDNLRKMTTYEHLRRSH